MSTAGGELRVPLLGGDDERRAAGSREADAYRSGSRPPLGVGGVGIAGVLGRGGGAGGSGGSGGGGGGGGSRATSTPFASEQQRRQQQPRQQQPHQQHRRREEHERWPQPRVAAHAGAGLESFDYEPVANEVVAEETRQRLASREGGRKHFYGYTGLTFAKYFLTLLVGVSTGTIAFCITGVVRRIYALKQWLILEHFARGGVSVHYEYVASFAAFCLALVLVASSLCLFWAPQAAGGGVTLVMAYLNGRVTACHSSVITDASC